MEARDHAKRSLSVLSAEALEAPAAFVPELDCQSARMEEEHVRWLRRCPEALACPCRGTGVPVPSEGVT